MAVIERTLMTIGEFCSEFGVSRSTVYRLRESGALPFCYIGKAPRIKRAAAMAWLASLPDVALPANDE